MWGKNEWKESSLRISLALIFLILASTVALAMQYTKIGSGSEPAVDGNKVAWTCDVVIHVYDQSVKVTGLIYFCTCI